MQRTYRSTVAACCIGYTVQATVNNLAPLLFVIFRESCNLSYGQLGLLVSLNFGTQLVVDVLSARYTDRIGRRKMAIIAHAFAAVGLVMMGLTPFLFKGAEFIGLASSAVLYAIGGGIIEVIVTPIASDCPTDNKARVVTVLHSFYCWGQMGVILISTLLLMAIGRENWFLLPFIWALIPAANLFNFITVPLTPPVSDELRTPLRKLLTSRIFIFLMIMILCGGASEVAMAQWASMFAEKGLGVSKTVGDILGPCLFALLMGCGRLAYGKFSNKLPVKPAVAVTSLLCIGCYLTASLCNNGIIALIACAVTGLSISLMWTSAVILAERGYPNSGTAMYGALAVCGDLGCSLGPWLVGIISDGVQNGSINALVNASSSDAAGLRSGLLISTVFPLIVFITLFFIPDRGGTTKNE